MANIFRVDRTNNKIGLGTTGTTINITSHTASLLLGLDASKNLESVDLSGVYQPLDAVLTDIAALGVVADNEFIVGTGVGTYAHESGATVRTSIGLGTGDSPAFSGLTISKASQTEIIIVDSSIPFSGRLITHSGTGGLWLETITNHPLYFTTNSQPARMTIQNDGKIGIGLIAPKTLLTIEGTLTLKEQAAADGDTAAYGQIWIKTATPNELWFTDDAGTDHQIAFV